ncbi:MAG: DUF1877 family protein [Rhodobacteraceae bacterium]|nr:DUF1877 family protein [Paracoccaceae bacterium]
MGQDAASRLHAGRRVLSASAPRGRTLSGLSVEEVRAASNHLTGISPETIDKRLHNLSDNATPIYGGPVPVDAFGQVREALEIIRDFFAKAAEAGQAVTKAMS